LFGNTATTGYSSASISASGFAELIFLYKKAYFSCMKPFAIYFPQFYPTKTNDSAWGTGFTDWVLVANANLRDAWPRRAPAAGFYDGSSTSVHNSQIAEALSSGIGGFGIYHYWFYTHQELDAFETTLLNKNEASQTIPWFLIWASESWSKRWLADPQILVNLNPEPRLIDIERHCTHIAKCFSNPSYFHWRGKPLFVWYNLGHFKEPERVVSQYRQALRQHGFEFAAAHFVKYPFDLDFSPFMDASYLFEPRLFFGTRSIARGAKSKVMSNALRKLAGGAIMESILVAMDRLKKDGVQYNAKSFLSYFASPERAALINSSSRPYQDVISPGWNNTPRYGKRFTALEPMEPEAFGALVERSSRQGDLPPLINAWNEWSEGAAIEPCSYRGREYLNAIQKKNPRADVGGKLI
jgi:Glycosyltransferase WbsX